MKIELSKSELSIITQLLDDQIYTYMQDEEQYNDEITDLSRLFTKLIRIEQT